MRRVVIRFLALLAVLSTVFAIGLQVHASSTVTYDGNARKFIFAPDNLFSAFQGVMPGDTLTDRILVKNEASNKVKIKVYMRSLGAQKDTADFLSQLDLNVKQAGNSVLFDAPADQKAQLTEWVYLGTVYSGGEITLDVTLNVPKDLGDAYQNKVGYVDWEFMVEELPVEPTDPQPPKTGDTAIFWYFGLMVFSLLGLLVLLLYRKKRSNA